MRFPFRLFACITITVTAGLFLRSVLADELQQVAQTLPKLQYNEDGSMNRPEGYRRWVTVGSTVLPKGEINIIDKKPAKSAEELQVFVEPAAFDIYMKTGVWPDGTRIVKEFIALKDPDEHNVTVQDYYTGLSMLVKDSKKFPAEGGHLGYFSFGHQRQPYLSKSPVMARENCSKCHEEGASKEQFIFSSRHIGLNRKSQ